MTTCFDIRTYGAIGDGTTKDTVAIQNAVDAAAEKGGTVVVPQGTFLTGMVQLKSHVTFHLSQGATILGSPDLADYPPQSWGHHDDRTPYHLIFAEDAHHIAITGDGTIAGNGSHFHKPGRAHDWAFWSEIPLRPSPMVEICRCRDVRIESIRLTEPGGWTLHLHDCDRAFIRGITIDNSLFWPNSDGIDLTGCHDTIISDCYIHTGDDAIALKTTIDSRSCEHITVTNCVLETSCAAIRLGFESDQDFLNCTFSNITIKNCSRGIDLLTFSGGNIENCSFTNIVGRCMSGWTFDRPIEINADFTTTPYKCVIPEHPNCGMVYPERPAGRIKGITITNLDLESCGRILMAAADDAIVEDISLDHIRLRYPMIDDPGIVGATCGGKGFFAGESLNDFRAARAAMVMQNLKDIRVRDFRVQWPAYPLDPSRIELLRSENRKGNPYFDNMEGVLSGAAAPAFQTIWARNCQGWIDHRGATASMEGTEPMTIEASRLEAL